MPRPFLHGYSLRPGQPPKDDSEVFAAGLAWASGGIVSTPADTNAFIRAYLGLRFFSRRTQQAQLRFVPGSSDPPGPGANAAGLAIFRYRTRCGTVYGHTGTVFGYTQFAAASRDGTGSVTATATEQLARRGCTATSSLRCGTPNCSRCAPRPPPRRAPLVTQFRADRCRLPGAVLSQAVSLP
jgi:D-alanyl-D-alanine carboxypeptidase